MIKQISVALGLSLCGLLLVGCASNTSPNPILVPPPPGAVHDQVSGVHSGSSPLYREQLKNPPPYLKKSDHFKHD